MRVAVIGAGVAGLATAKVLTQAGHVVRVYDRTPDVGGVWSATRRYPGLTTQSPKAQYALSDFPMPDDYPEWPTGEQVQRWLAAYAERFALDVVHTFRNSSDEEARVISVVSPAGLERYYQALAELPEGPPDISAIKEIMADFGLQLRIPPQAG